MLVPNLMTVPTDGSDAAPAHDGMPLLDRWWMPSPNPSRALILLFHGGHEHSGRFGELVESLSPALPGAAPIRARP